jgi:hypothetical protein
MVLLSNPRREAEVHYAKCTVKTDAVAENRDTSSQALYRRTMVPPFNKIVIHHRLKVALTQSASNIGSGRFKYNVWTNSHGPRVDRITHDRIEIGAKR